MDHTGVPEGDLRPVVLNPGDLIHWMAFAKDGEPFFTERSIYVATDYPLTGVGYEFERNGITYIFVKIDACQNWAIVSRAPLAMSSSLSYSNTYVTEMAPIELGFVPETFHFFDISLTEYTEYTEPFITCDCDAPDLASVPLSGASVFYILSLLSLSAFFVRNQYA